MSVCVCVGGGGGGGVEGRAAAATTKFTQTRHSLNRPVKNSPARQNEMRHSR